MWLAALGGLLAHAQDQVIVMDSDQGYIWELQWQGEHLLVADSDQAYLYATDSLDLVRQQHLWTWNPSVSLSGDGATMLTVGRRARVWETASGDKLQGFKASWSENPIALDHQGGRVLRTSYMGLEWVRVQDGEPLGTLEADFDGMSLSRSGEDLLVVGYGQVHRVRPDGGVESWAAGANAYDIMGSESLALLPSWASGVQVLDLESGELRPLDLPPTAQLALSPDGRLLAYQEASTQRIHVVELESGRTLRVIPSLETSPFLAFSPDGGRLAVSGAGIVRVFDLSIQRPVPELTPVNLLGFQGDLALILRWDGQLEGWDPQGQRQASASLSIPMRYDPNATFLPDGELLMISTQGAAQRVDAWTGAQLAGPYPGNRDEGLVLSNSDGSYAVLSSGWLHAFDPQGQPTGSSPATSETAWLGPGGTTLLQLRGETNLVLQDVATGVSTPGLQVEMGVLTAQLIARPTAPPAIPTDTPADPPTSEDTGAPTDRPSDTSPPEIEGQTGSDSERPDPVVVMRTEPSFEPPAVWFIDTNGDLLRWDLDPASEAETLAEAGDFWVSAADIRGEHALLVDNEGHAKLHDLDGNLLHTGSVPLPAGRYITHAAVHPQHPRALIALDDGSVLQLDFLGDAVTHLGDTLRGGSVIDAQGDKLVQVTAGVLVLHEGDQSRKLKPEQTPSAAVFLADGSLLVGDTAGGLQLWDGERFGERLQIHDAPIVELAPGPAGVAVRHDDGGLGWVPLDLSGSSVLGAWAANGVDVSPQGIALSVASYQGVSIYPELGAAESEASLKGSLRSGLSGPVSACPDGTGVVAVDQDWGSPARIARVVSGKVVPLDAHFPAGITALECTDAHILVGHASGETLVLDAQGQTLQRVLASDGGAVHDLAVSGQQLYVSSETGQVSAWDLETGAFQGDRRLTPQQVLGQPAGSAQ
ncbi:MAG: hypothetical protein VX899_01315 [Myxococcota bacterium]|nr:hypothetical protein [Myxococcota bacterium]